MNETAHISEAKRTALILAFAQAFVGAVATVAISIGGLTGSYLLGDDQSLATAPVTGYNLGVAIGALPAAMLMRAIGRRYGFMSGAFVTGIGGGLAALAIFASSFWGFAASLVLIGVGGAFVQQYRFAAADNAPESFKPRAISWVLCGGIFAAIIGPQLVIYTREYFAPVSYAGAYTSIILLSFIGFIALMFLRLPRDQISETIVDTRPARPLMQIISQPRFIVALICAIGAYALMSFVMTGAPLAMVGCGFSPDQSTLGISWHVLAMFGPSFFTGRLIARFGKERIIAAGMILLIASAIISLSGIQLWNFWLGLILLGVGWNFGFIGATAMVAQTYRASEKNSVQGFHDFVLFGSVAFASFMSGKIYNSAGWDMLNWSVFPVTIFCLLALLSLRLLPKSDAA